MTEKYDLKALKAALLKSDDYVIETQIFGAKAFIRRLKAAELQENEDGMKAAIDSGDMSKAAQLNVQLLLSCLMTPDGKRIPAGALPSVDDLLAAHDNPTLVEAIGAVKRHAVGSLEEAEKN
ncbi:phage tail protein [Serratia marcescens]|nr:phage tail protein [Serratia marcescens]